MNNYRNDEILAQVEQLGGGYVWEPESFAVMLLEVTISDAQALQLAELQGVDQIAINSSELSHDCLKAVAGIPSLQSLVLSDSHHLEKLRQEFPSLEVIQA